MGGHFITALLRNVLIYIQNGEHHGNHQEGALTADDVQNALKKIENHLNSVTHLSEKKGNHVGRNPWAVRAKAGAHTSKGTTLREPPHCGPVDPRDGGDTLMWL